MAGRGDPRRRLVSQKPLTSLKPFGALWERLGQYPAI
jgi:hypothetical protein